LLQSAIIVYKNADFGDAAGEREMESKMRKSSMSTRCGRLGRSATVHVALAELNLGHKETGSRMQ